MQQHKSLIYKDVDLSWMIGRSITGVSFNEPIPWVFAFEPETNISVACLWRFVEHNRIILCCEDHGQQFGLPAPVNAISKIVGLLVGRSIKAVQLRETTADLTIEFSDDCRLEIIPDSSGYESWEVHAPFSVQYIAQGGGSIVKFTPQVKN